MSSSDDSFTLTWRDLLKYLVEGTAVSVVAFLLSTKNNKDIISVLMIGLTAAIVFFILDKFAPRVSAGARQGAGFGVGWNLVGGGEDETVSSSGTEKFEEASVNESFNTEDAEQAHKDAEEFETATVSTEHTLNSTSTTEGFETYEGFATVNAPFSDKFKVDEHNAALY